MKTENLDSINNLQKEIIEQLIHVNYPLFFVVGNQKVGKTTIANKMFHQLENQVVIHSGTHPDIREKEFNLLIDRIKNISEPCLVICDECFYPKKTIENTNHRFLIFTNDQRFKKYNHMDISSVFDYSKVSNEDLLTRFKNDSTSKNTSLKIKIGGYLLEEYKSYDKIISSRIVVSPNHKEINDSTCMIKLIDSIFLGYLSESRTHHQMIVAFNQREESIIVDGNQIKDIYINHIHEEILKNNKFSIFIKMIEKPV
jgi:hypothetical protein